MAVLSEAAAATASAAIAEQLASPDAASALLSTSSSMRVSVDPAVPSSVGAVETTAATQHAFTTSVRLDGGSAAEYGATERSALAAAFAAGADVPLESVSVAVVDRADGGGVEVVATVSVATAAAAATAATLVEAQLATPAAASSFLTPEPAASAASASSASGEVSVSEGGVSVGSVSSSSGSSHAFTTSVSVEGGRAVDYGSAERAALAAAFAEGAGTSLDAVSVVVVDRPPQPPFASSRGAALPSTPASASRTANGCALT